MVASCCNLGGKFMQWNWQAKGWDVMLLKNVHRELYSKRWAVRV